VSTGDDGHAPDQPNIAAIDGARVPADWLAEWEAECARFGIPPRYARRVAALATARGRSTA
jgi:hypothetical protein